MADDDDDDSFGEFTFASNQTTVNTSPQIPVTTSDDDDWGDFNFIRNNTTDHHLKSPQPQPQIQTPTPTQPKWEKIKGALPLSLFGGEEEDDEEQVMPVAGNDVKQSSCPGNSGFASNKNNDRSNSHLGINDLIANLYGPRQQQLTTKAADNGNELNFTATNSPASKDPLSKSDVLSNGNGLDSNASNSSVSKDPLSKSASLSNGNELDFTASNSPVSKDPFSKSDSLNSFSLNADAASANHGSDDEGGWEFIDAFSDSKLPQNGKDNKGHSEKPGLQDGSHGSTTLFGAPNNGVFVESHVTDSGLDSKPITNIQNGFTLDIKADSKGTTNEINSNPPGETVDIDDGFGEFETAFMEQPSKKKEVSEGSNSPLGLHDASHKPVDLFSFPNELNGGSHKENNGFDFTQTEWNKSQDVLVSQPLGGDENFGKFEMSFSEFGSKPEGSTPSSKNYKELNGGSHKENNGFDFTQTEWNKSQDVSVSQSPGGDEKFGKFEMSFSEIGSKPEGSTPSSKNYKELNGGSHKENNGFDFTQTEWNKSQDVSVSLPPGGDESFGKFEMSFSEIGSKPEGSTPSSKNYKEPVPLSIFGIEEEPEVESSINLHHELFKSSHGKHTRTHSSNLSISDILSDLYSQSEPIKSANHEHNPDEKKDDNENNDDDDDYNFDDGSWEFKDASSLGNKDLSSKGKLNNFIDFYSKLKDELSIVARNHLYGLKKAQSTATLAGDEMKVDALNKEIQDAYNQLHQKDIISSEVHTDLVISLEQYIKTLHEPDFLILDSEYHISTRLSLAESDLQTAIDLINHITTLLKIIALAPKGEPRNYVTEWSKVISVCSQELKHGTWIWNQSLQKNIHSEILSEQQGKHFINALGEIYRVVVILGTAVEFYKPWILLSGEDLEGCFGLLKECHSLWSTSGLEEVIPEYLLKSIKSIQNLDEVAIANEILSQSQCRLSLLSPGVVPEMKMVIWNGDAYFVALANLWANLISPDPPNLSIRVV